jgi:hypothetical protein
MLRSLAQEKANHGVINSSSMAQRGYFSSENPKNIGDIINCIIAN